MSPRRRASAAARIRRSAWRRCSELVRIVTLLSRRGGRGVDGGHDARGAVEFGLETGSFGCSAAAERADEGGGAVDGVCPDGAASSR
jgi:hypothetical protein